MPKVDDSEFKARAARMVRDHRADYPSVTAVCFAVAGQVVDVFVSPRRDARAAHMAG